MDITIFVVFLVLALVLVGFSLYRPEHSELGLIGFVFLFLLSFLVINGTISHTIGTQTNSTFAYSVNASGTGQTLLTSSTEDVVDLSANYTFDGVLAHTIGYWMAIISIVGFITIIIGIRASLRG